MFFAFYPVKKAITFSNSRAINDKVVRMMSIIKGFVRILCGSVSVTAPGTRTGKLLLLRPIYRASPSRDYYVAYKAWW
jgi:hypothetical protein